MKIALLGLSIETKFDREELEAARIERAAQAIIRAESRKLEVDARAAVLREQEAQRRAQIAARVEELKANAGAA